jgi:hypothetical protein
MDPLPGPASSHRRWRRAVPELAPVSPCAAGEPLGAGELGGDALGLLQNRVDVFCLDEFVGLQVLEGPVLLTARLDAAAARESGRSTMTNPSYWPNIK